MQPAQRVLQGKSKEPVQKAKTEQDWLDQEKAERITPKNTGDLINDTVGRFTYEAGASRADWISPSLKRRLTVSRFYFGDKPLIIDKPGTIDEMADKTKFFANTKIAYVGIAPGTAIDPEDLAQMVEKAFAAKKAPGNGKEASKKAIPAGKTEQVSTAKKSNPPKAKKAKGKKGA